ncbi:unnamed protein product [Agarophyton chilense]|eukprot:gb/GEZJ01001620.1/.p2 GENE.gb/GEZJ01001620.1/~~gb/GEZJ01001620.1/.p2  ORF type:complete len:323 (-),score=21.83 gb/GEZJ01001620.1/:3361-4329(-)
MSDTCPSKTLPPELQLRTQIADDLVLAQVDGLVEGHTEWNRSPIAFHLLESPIIAFTAHERDTRNLVGSALLAAQGRDSFTWWAGFVVVSSRWRRRGVGTCLMQALLEYASTHPDVHFVELLATLEGAMLYRTLGFQNTCDMNVCLMQHDGNKHRPSEVGHDALVLTDVPSTLRNEAKKLYCRVAGNDRSKVVETLFNHATCVLQRHTDGTILAIAWLRVMENKSVETWWLGPLLSYNAKATKSLIHVAILHVHEHSTAPKTRLQTLSLNNSSTFEQVGFRKLRSTPLMRRGTALPTTQRKQSEAMNRDLGQYVSLCDFHNG